MPRSVYLMLHYTVQTRTEGQYHLGRTTSLGLKTLAGAVSYVNEIGISKCVVIQSTIDMTVWDRKREEIADCIKRLKSLGPTKIDERFRDSMDDWLTDHTPVLRVIASHPIGPQAKDVQFPCVSLNANRFRHLVDADGLLKAIRTSLHAKPILGKRKRAQP